MRLILKSMDECALDAVHQPCHGNDCDLKRATYGAGRRLQRSIDRLKVGFDATMRCQNMVIKGG